MADMNEPKATTAIQARGVPTKPLEYLRKYAVDEGYGNNDAGVTRYAIVKLATQLGWKPDDNDGQPTDESPGAEKTRTEP